MLTLSNWFNDALGVTWWTLLVLLIGVLIGRFGMPIITWLNLKMPWSK